MKKVDQITLTRDGGKYIHAMAFHWLFVLVTLLPVVLLLILGIVNPFWFRSSMFNWIERAVKRITRWRDYIKYRIYLGTDPKMWHALRNETLGQ